MGKYKANEVLAQVLLDHGLIETTLGDKLEIGKRSFRAKKRGLKKILFDYQDIKVMSRGAVHDSRFAMSADELRALLLYFAMDGKQWKRVMGSRFFSFDEFGDKLKAARNELKYFKDAGQFSRKKRAVEAMLAQYDSYSV